MYIRDAQKIAGGDEKAEKTLDWLLVKTTLDVYGMPTTGFKPEHLPVRIQLKN